MRITIEVLEPEAIGNDNDGDAGGDDDKILVSSSLAAWRQSLVFGTTRECTNMTNVQGDVVWVVHLLHCVKFRVRVSQSRYLTAQRLDVADVGDPPDIAAG